MKLFSFLKKILTPQEQSKVDESLTKQVCHKNLKDFQQINIDVLTSKRVTVDFFESNINTSILLIKIQGEILDGSKGSSDSEYIKQRIGLALVSWTFTAVILDLTELEYRFGDSIIDAFMPIDNIRVGEEKYLTSSVISDKNKFGLSTIWCFDINKPREPIFYNLDDAFKYIDSKL
jgi:hypothetical protein